MQYNCTLQMFPYNDVKRITILVSSNEIKILLHPITVGHFNLKWDCRVTLYVKAGNV